MTMNIVHQQDLFVSGEHGYTQTRIPALAVLSPATVLAFAEGRRGGGGDHDAIELLMRRSTDGGQTWEPHVSLYGEGEEADQISIGNPCVVHDPATARTWLVFCRNNRDVLLMHSDDAGDSWSAPRDITATVKPANWEVYWTGPGHGIVLASGGAAGRLLIPSYHTEEVDGVGYMCCHALYSDDHGATWQIGASTRLADGVPTAPVNWDNMWHGCECMAAERADGSLYLTVRNQLPDTNRRAWTVSHDSGETWSPMQLAELPDPVCLASLVGLADGPTDDLLLACLDVRNDTGKRATGRRNLSLTRSSDGGRSWSACTPLHAGASAYSDLARLADGTALCLYECGETTPYQRLRLARIQVTG